MNSISVIIPAFNEQGRLPKTLHEVHAFLSLQRRDFEILVVSDGSTDGTVSLVKDFANSHEGVKLLSYPRNRGKGFAVRYGVLRALYSRILINDADGSTNIEELLKFDKVLDEGLDIAIGSRNMGDDLQEVRTSAHRKIIGNFFNFFVQFLLLPGIKDTQCGFKLFVDSVAKDLFSSSSSDGFSFDVEVLTIARSRGYIIKEIPINWTNAPGSKVNLTSDPLVMGFDVIELFFKKITGKLNRQNKQAIVLDEPVQISLRR